MCGGSYAFWFSLIKYRLAKPLPCLFLFSQDNSFMHTAEKPGEGSVLTRKVSKCCDSLHSGSDQSSRWPSSICLFHVVLYAQASMILPLLNLTFSPSRDISKLLALIPLTSCNITQVLGEYAGLYHQLTEVAGVKVRTDGATGGGYRQSLEMLEVECRNGGNIVPNRCPVDQSVLSLHVDLEMSLHCLPHHDPS